MRPLKVTMTAFGPYKNKEIVDFTELKENRLFVISGNTGAGKTTIFDAICFALYGDASGEDRNDVRMLRSDFADDDIHTSVELEFELKGRVFRVFRQLAHVKEGNKGATGERYELFEITDDKVIPLTDRFIVSQVNEKIQAIIGLTKEQFSQIVMLPQGEFRKLLTSETENKEEILRRIFKTGFYKTVGDHLNLKRRDAQKLFDEQVQTRDIYIQNVKVSLPNRENSLLFQVLSQEYFNTHQVLNGLEEEITFYETKHNELKASLQEKIKSLQDFSDNFYQAKHLNERFNQLDEKLNFKSSLDKRTQEMEEKEQKYLLAEKAGQLEMIEKHFEQMKNEFIQKQAQLEAEYKNYLIAEQKQKIALENYRMEEDRATDREKVTIELDRLIEFVPTVRDLEEKKNQLRKLQNEELELSKNVQTIESLVEKKLNEKKELIQRIKPLEAKVRNLTEKTEEISELRSKAIVLRDYLKLLNTYQNDKQLAHQNKEIFVRIDHEFELLEKCWIEGQASILALHLHDGKPCPVCGSDEHPNKATILDSVPTKEELEEKREEKKRVEQIYNETKAKEKVSFYQMEEKLKEVEENGFHSIEAEQSYTILVEQGKALDKEIQELKTDQLLLDQLKTSLETVEKEAEEKSVELTETKTRLLNIHTDFQTARTVYEQSVLTIPENLRSLDELQLRIQQLEQKKMQFEQQWKKAQTDYQSLTEQLATAKANVENSQIQIFEVKGKLDNAEKEYVTSISKAGFATEENYKRSKIDFVSREALKNEIEEYKSNLKTVLIQINELDIELKNKKRQDMTVLEESLKTKENEVEHIRTLSQQTENYLSRAMEGKKNIKQSEDQLIDVEQKVQLIKDLYDVVRGDNSKKVSFERYLQIEFLEQIIHAANERLKQLSNGQYFLVRSDRLEKRGKQSGLGLDVLDHYTGQYRDVKSLSGGEKFNASLCLALGMADVIQAYEGGISIETMFIDEGFGSLDEESLNKAIDTLIDLQQSGRMIGVISHVAELKQAIPAILEVTKSKEGFSQTRFVLN